MNAEIVCRASQLVLLRLLTQRKVMGEQNWRTLTAARQTAPSLWTDRYLLDFARRAGLTLATLDQALGASPDLASKSPPVQSRPAPSQRRLS
jgi:predicted nucleic acid-binding protein